jgi:hypothetical protein
MICKFLMTGGCIRNWDGGDLQQCKYPNSPENCLDSQPAKDVLRTKLELYPLMGWV